MSQTPLGWFESNEGGFQKLGLGGLSRHSNHHFITWLLGSPGLARIRSRGDVRGRSNDREVMGLGVSR
eukprot:3181115-Prymnesium_polylepis.1